MSLIIKGMKMPQHAAVNGEKDTAYRCAILAHADNSVDLVMDAAFASAYDNGHNIQRYPIIEISTPHGRLIDADAAIARLKHLYCDGCGCDCSTCPWRAFIKYLDGRPTIIETEK